MNTDPRHGQTPAAPGMVEDLFLTDAFLIKGRLASNTTGFGRSSRMPDGRS